MTTTSGPNRPMLTYLRIEGYGCIQDATFALTPLHALIGPNDSGKSTTLRALRTLSLLASPKLLDDSTDGRRLWEALVRSGRPGVSATLSLGLDDSGWRVTSKGPQEQRFERVPKKDRRVIVTSEEGRASLSLDSHGSMLKGHKILKTAASFRRRMILHTAARSWTHGPPAVLCKITGRVNQGRFSCDSTPTPFVKLVL